LQLNHRARRTRTGSRLWGHHGKSPFLLPGPGGFHGFGGVGCLDVPPSPAAALRAGPQWKRGRTGVAGARRPRVRHRYPYHRLAELAFSTASPAGRSPSDAGAPACSRRNISARRVTPSAVPAGFETLCRLGTSLGLGLRRGTGHMIYFGGVSLAEEDSGQARPAVTTSHFYVSRSHGV
jgi:hypothetical protein